MSPARPARLLLAVLTGACLLAGAAPAHAQSMFDSRDTELVAVGGLSMGTHATVAVRAPGLPALPAPISAKSFVVADLGTGEVLAGRDPHGRYLPASTLKTLTAVALIPELDPQSVHVAKFSDVNIEGSKVGLVTGQRYTIETLLKAMLVVSGNDAAHSLASAAGGMPRALSLLNATAERLQAKDTHAVNTSGLDATGQVTSAYDLALITREGMRLADYRRYVRVVRDRVNAPNGGSFEIYNHNKLLTRYPGVDGGKTGYTVAARHSYVVTATRGGHRLVVTMLKSESNYQDARLLLDWGFAVAGRGQAVGQLVEPLGPAPAPRVTTAQADRSRVVGAPDAGAHSAQKVSSQQTPAPTQSGFPVPPVAAGAGLVVLAAGGVVVRRRRRRRRMYGASSLSLKLPVR
jgi:D-alanyl-D-alanine carboxypeptidase (penicillin-binding protein 5/6)